MTKKASSGRSAGRSTTKTTKITKKKSVKKKTSSGKATASKRQAKSPTKPQSKTRKAASRGQSAKPVDTAASVPRVHGGKVTVTPRQRRAMIAEAAYYKAQARGFADGDIVRDWTEAEAEIDARILRVSDADN